jgi:hypothetical protein
LELAATLWVIKVIKVERKYHLRQVRRELSEDVGCETSDCGMGNTDLERQGA